MTERVTVAGVESGGDQYQLRLQFFGNEQEFLLECPQNFRAARTCWKWTVDGHAFPRPFSGFIRRASAGIPRVLVRAEKQHSAIRVENILSAVAVMNVPIGDQH